MGGDGEARRSRDRKDNQEGRGQTPLTREAQCGSVGTPGGGGDSELSYLLLCSLYAVPPGME